MKKKIFLAMVALMFSSALFAVELDLKGGAMHPTPPNKFGLDTALAFNYDLNQYFLIGAEAGCGWVSWAGMGTGISHPYKDAYEPTFYRSHSADVYYVPALLTLTAEVQYAELIPYISGGAGYGWAWYRGYTANNVTNNDDKVKDKFSGFTWQILGGIKWKFKSSVLFITEMGFRRARTDNSRNVILDMTGWMGRVGICIPFGSTYSSTPSKTN